MLVKIHTRQFDRIFESAEFIGYDDFRIDPKHEVGTI
jgi:hypothetical protein